LVCGRMDAFSKEDQSAILARTQNLSEQHRAYLAAHPELTQLLHDLLCNCLVNKPEDPFHFCREYFYGLKGGDGVGDATIGWGYKGKCRALLVTGPTGAGKHVAVRQLANKLRLHFGVAVSHTTRKPRNGEKDGVDYIFTDKEAMSIAMQAGEFLCVTEVEGELYGVKKDRVDTVTASGRVCVISCSKLGAMAIRKAMAGNLMPRTLYLHPASSDELTAHLNEQNERRGGINVEERVGRAEANWEALCSGPKGVFDHEIDINYDPDEPFNLSSESMDEIEKWCIGHNWEVTVDTDMDRAAVKIQGQARRRRDANRVKHIKSTDDT